MITVKIHPPHEVNVAANKLTELYEFALGRPAKTAKDRRVALEEMSISQLSLFASNANTVIEYVWDYIAKPVE